MNQECYVTGYECQVVDNFAFKIQTGDIYERVLNPTGECCVSIPGITLTRRYGRTFEENDPYRKMAQGLPASDAAFDDKIDGHYFLPDICEEQQVETDYNIESINFFDYTLDSTKTKLTQVDPITGDKVTIAESDSSVVGKVFVRNTTGSVVEKLENLLPGLQSNPDIYNNITDFTIVYDNIILYTSDSMYIDQINYNYTQGDFASSTTTPVKITSTPDPREQVMKAHFNPVDQDIMVGKMTVVNNKLIVPQLYRYNANTHVYSVAYDGVSNVKDHIKLGLSPDIYNDFVINSVDRPIICYNDKLQKYSVVSVASLSATPQAIAAAGEWDSLLGNFFCVLVYNFKNYNTGLELIDSTIFHTPNKRQLKYKDITSSRTLELSSTNEFINIGLITDPSTNFTLNFRNAPVRESKLKHVTVTYDGVTYIKNRLPVNDMLYADIPHINTMVEGFVPHASGGPIDFASPRYQDISIDLNLNLHDISVVELSGQAVYYDGHVETYKMYGESRPLPLANVFGHMSLINAVSYTTETRSNLIKCTFETTEPNYVTDVIIDNGSLAETTSDIIQQRNLYAPSLSTESPSGGEPEPSNQFTEWDDTLPWLDSSYWVE